MPPYDVELVKARDGYYVKSKDTGKKHSKKPLSKKKALAQMRAIYANDPSRRAG